MSLISKVNAKTVKGEKYNYLTGILYMMPDVRTCSFALKAGCLKSCLVFSGYAQIYSSINQGRTRKRELFFNNNEEFFNILIKDIEQYKRRAKRNNMQLAIRLNGTSDIEYENIPVRGYNNIFEMFPDVQFYDYTKIVERFNRVLPSNYDLTFSYSGTEEYRPSVEEAIRLKVRTAFVYQDTMPTEFMGMPVINGDEHDLRFTEPKHVAIALRAKGKKAKSSNSKFFV